MSHLADINKILKDHGLGFVTYEVKAVHGTKSKTFRNWQDESYKGISGGSIGPMTVTNAHQEKNKEIQRKLMDALTPLVNEIASKDDGFCIVFELTPGKFRHIDFRWSTFPAYARNVGYSDEYENYWLVARSNDYKASAK